MNCHFHLAAGWLTACRGECMPLQLSALFMWVTVSTYMALYCIFLELWLCGAYKSTVWDTRWLTLWVQWPLPLGFYCVLSRLFSILLSMITVWLQIDLKGKKTCSNDVVRLVIELIGRYCSDNKQTTNRNLKISGTKFCVLPTDCIFLYKYQCHVTDSKMQFIRIVLA